MSECVNFSIWLNFKLDCTRSIRRFSSSPATAFHVGRWCGRGASGASRLLRNAGISLPKQHARRMERNCTVGPGLAERLGHWHKFHYSTVGSSLRKMLKTAVVAGPNLSSELYHFTPCLSWGVIYWMERSFLTFRVTPLPTSSISPLTIWSLPADWLWIKKTR